MKIHIEGQGWNAIKIDERESVIVSSKETSISLDLRQPDDPDRVKLRHPGQLVMRHGWVHLDYDADGYLVRLEFCEGDPYVASTEEMEYLQPKSPTCPESPVKF